MQRTISRLFIACGLAASATAAHAGIANGGFELGFTGWTYVGNSGSSPTSTIIARDPIHMGQQAPLSGQWGPVEGDRFAALWSTDSIDQRGATLSQRFAANAGDVLEFMVFYDFGDFAPSTDGAFVRLDDGASQTDLARFNMDAGSALDDDTNVGWHRISHVLPMSATGFYDLTFSISDSDGMFESILGVDDVRIVPTPGTVGLIALAGLITRRRRSPSSPPRSAHAATRAPRRARVAVFELVVEVGVRHWRLACTRRMAGLTQHQPAIMRIRIPSGRPRPAPFNARSRDPPMPNRTALRLAASILALASGAFVAHGAGTVSGGSTSKSTKSAKPVASVKAKRAAAAPVKADAALPTPELSPRRVLVRTKPGGKAKDLARLDAKAGVVKVVFEYTLVPGLRCVEVKPGREDAAVKAYKASSMVRYAHRDRIVHAAGQTVPYGVVSVRSPQTWTASRGGGAVVAVLDTGFDFGHPDLPEPMLSQSFVADQPVQDGNSHGTHCSGTVLAVDDAGGVVGVAPAASLMIGKVLGDGGSGSTAGVMAGAEWAATNGADVISMSLGSTGSDQAEADLYAAIHASGVLIVAAAGNNNSGDPFFPASYPGVMSVAAVDSANNRAGFSNFGPNISVAAPGVGVLSTVPTGIASWADTNHESTTLAGSARGSAGGLSIDCGLGGDASNFPAEVAGNIAFIRRGGGIPFATKAANAVAAGAVGVIIANNAAGLFNGTLNGNSTVPVIGISQADGDDLLGRGAIPVTIATSGGHGYAAFSGTSMACPHVAGVAALLIAEVGRGRVTPALLREAMEATATDLGDPGRDDLYGHGLVNAEAAAAYLRNRVGAWCPADFDDNGGVDGLDVEAFFTNWMASRMIADVDLDATVDAGDVAAFLDVWTAGGC